MKKSIKADAPEVKSLLDRVLQFYGRPVGSLLACEQLSDDIFIKTHYRVNADTLRRLLGLRSDGYSTVRRTTLNILAQYVGFFDFDKFLNQLRDEGEAQSELTEVIDTVNSANLRTGCRLSISWQPNRRCTLSYKGNLMWQVESVENSSTLRVGDTLFCSQFANGQMVFADRLVRGVETLGGLRLGINGGVHIETIDF